MAILKDLTGQRFESLLVLGLSHKDRHGYLWKCLCDCGTVKNIRGGNLTQNRTKTCGCFTVGGNSFGSRPVADLVGKSFNRLTVTAHDDQRSKPGKHYWLCDCSCGHKTSVEGCKLKSGHTKSCGCFQIESRVNTNLKHGCSKGYDGRNSGTKEYLCWRNVRGRCQNKNDRFYPDYGGRGIEVCSKWNNSFEAFLSDMGLAPSPKHSIDRIDNNGNYEPGNCRWATSLEQANNNRANHFIEINGETKTVADWARALGIKYPCLLARIKQGRDPVTGKSS